jgi:putative spermidine/putrescine transport system substrate-binding protein
MRKLHAIATATAMLALCTSGAATAQEKVLRVMNSGGSYGDSIEECVNKPLMEQEGIKVVQESPGGFAKLQAQGRSGVIANTTTDASTGDLLRMVAADLVEPIDWEKLDPLPMFDEAKAEYGFGASFYSTIMAWDAEKEEPADWVAFFDTEANPGMRALPDYPDFVLPFAALGGGQSIESISEGVDLDLAFETLNRVKDDVVWWQSGAQPPQLLQDGEADYAIAWSGRVMGQEGVDHSFKDGMLDISWWVIAKGITDEERDMLYAWLKLQTDANVQKCLIEFLPYPGPSPDLADLVSEEQAKTFPTYSANKDVQWLVPGQWWFDNADEVERRWNEFKLSL